MDLNEHPNDTKDAASQTNPAATSILERLSDSVDRGIARAFRWWGGFVSNRPYLVICSTTILGVLLTVAFFGQFKVERDSDDLFTPDNAESFDDKDYVDEFYGSYTARARILAVRHPDERVDDSCDEKLLLSDVESSRRNIQAWFRVYEEIRAVEIEYDGELYSLENVCIRPSENLPCSVTSILDLWGYNATVIEAPDFNPLERIDGDEPLLDRFGLELDVGLYLGKNRAKSCEREVDRSSNVEAFAMTVNYIYEQEEKDGAEIDPESQKWAERVADRVREISKGALLDTFLADEIAVGKESDEEIESDIALLSVGYVLIIAYTNVVLYKNNLLACKAHLTITSVMGIGLAIMSAFGLAQIFQVKFNTVVQVLPFLILGLGIDDTFVIVGAYHRVQYDLPVPEKIAQTLERAGSSIFVTSATDFLAFLMGMYTRLPAIRQFSAYAALAVMFDFAYQVTFFVAFLVLEARREERYRNGCSWLGVRGCCSQSEYDNKTIQATAPPPQEMTQLPTTNGEASEKSNANTNHSSPNPRVRKKICGEGDFDPEAPSFATKLAGTFIPSVTLHPIGRIAVIVAECTLLGFAIYGCTKVKMDFNYIDMFTPDDSPLKTGFNLEDEYFNGEQQLFSVYTRDPADGDYFYHQDELIALKTALENDPYVVPPVRTWYEGFSEWFRTEKANELVDGEIPDPESFNAWLMEYLDGDGQVYRDNVLFTNGTNRRVFSSKIDATTVNIIDGEQSVDLVDSIRDSIEEAAPSLDPIAFNINFLFFDGYRVIAWETVRNVMMAAVGVFVMNVIVLASVPMAFFVVSMVALTDVMLFGYMWYVDQYFNPVTAVNLVLAVGIAVDYAAHIAHSFLVVTGDRVERARGALEHIGGEVLSGAFTTWLGIVIMGAAQHYIFQSFFKMFFAIIVAGAWHGVIVLPVILSFFGSKPYASRLEATT